LLRPRTRWKLPPAVDEARAEALCRALDVSPPLARLLVARGFTDAEAARRFLFGSGEQFHDPLLLDGMEPAVERIRRAIRRGEKIRIYGDYDADGVCATSLMIGLFRQLGASFDYVIPHRQKEGYGLNGPAVEAAAAAGVGLIVTVDTGISAVEEAALAKKLGVDLIVTDHHEPPETLPEALAVVNPRKPGCTYPFKSLAGVGVAFKLAHALTGRLPEAFVWLAAVGTIADVMPLVDENRLIARLGLAQMRESPPPGIRALCRVSGIEAGRLSAGHIGFALGPRINAGGRLETADAAVACLTAGSEREAMEAAQELDRLNRERQKLVDDITREALEDADALLAAGDPGHAFVLAREGWNPGVIGIVASKVAERFHRPAVILSIDGQTGLAKGSARSIPGFDLHAALTECADLLEQFGGHKAAAGMTVRAEAIPALRRKLNEAAGARLGEEAPVPELALDAVIRPEEITVETIRQLDLLAPFGEGNPEPVFLLAGMRVRGMKRMGRDLKHAKLLLGSGRADSGGLDALLFGQAGLLDHISPTSTVDVVGALSVNEWNGLQKPQMIVRDLRVPDRQVFDWRGRTLEDPAVADWLAATAPEGDAGRAERGRPETPAAGALVFRRHDARLLPQVRGDAAGSAAVWLAEEDGTLHPLNDRAEHVPPHRVRHLMLPVLPPKAEPVLSALASFPDLERIYAVLYDPHPYLSTASAGREAFKRAYAALARRKGEALPLRGLPAALAKETGLTTDTIRFILAVFEQLKFLEAQGDRLVVAEHPARKSLDESPLYREMAHRGETERIFLFSTAAELARFLLNGERPESAASPAHAQEGLT